MPFVEMIYPGIDSELLQQTRAADSQHHFLDQTCFGFVVYEVKRQFIGVILSVDLFLPPVASQALAKIAEAIKQPDCYQRQVQVAGRLQMIAGQYPQPARIERQRVMYAELS